jgi:[ribosomal protein S5]-alanine N-acetyltransferase
MDYNGGIILETERLSFRLHIPADLEGFIAMEQHAGFGRYVGGQPRTREDAERRFQNGLKPLTDRLAMWATVYKPEQKYMGRCGVFPHFKSDGFPIPGEGSLGLYIAPEYWGRGLATEAGRAFVKFGFDELRLNKIVTTIDTRNNASIHIIEKLGFELKETEKGEYRSFYHYEINKTTEIKLT